MSAFGIMNNLTLPTSPVKPSEVNPRHLLIYGPSKIGKTTKVSELQNTLILDLEHGTDYIEATKVNVESYIHLIQLLNKIREQKKPYKILVIDTIDKLVEWLEEVATQNYRRSPIGSSFTGSSVLELPNGAGYLWLRNSFFDIISLLENSADYLIFIGHIRDKLIEVAGGKIEVSSKDLDLTGKIRNIICAKVSAIGTVYRDFKGQLCISFDTKEAINCGSRCAHLKGKKFENFQWKQIYPDNSTKLYTE